MSPLPQRNGHIFLYSDLRPALPPPKSGSSSLVSTATDSTLDAQEFASKHLKADGGENSMQKEMPNYKPTLLCSSLEQEVSCGALYLMSEEQYG